MYPVKKIEKDPTKKIMKTSKTHRAGVAERVKFKTDGEQTDRVMNNR